MARRRVYSNPPAAELLLSAVMPYVLGAVVLFYLKKKSESELPKKYAEVAKASGEIKAGLPGFVSDWWKGKTDSTYITAEEQKRRAQALLELNRAKAAVAGFAPVVYGQ